MMSFATTYTHTFKSGELKVGTVTLSGTSWTGAGTVGYWGWDGSKGIQIGSKNNPCKSYSLTTSAFADATITEVVVNTSMASSATAKLSISVGGTSYLSNKALTTSAANYTATGAASGDLVISYTNTARAFYIKSITVTYEAKEIEGPKYTVTANVNNPTMGSVTGAGEYGEGATATLTAIPNPAYKFVDWSNGSTDNPLKITVTENIELTANFEALPTMTCAEASAAANGATVVLNPFDVVYAVKGAGYIYIKDESGVALIFDYTLDDQLKAGDRVEGFVGTSSPYNGLPEIKPSVAFEDLTVTSGAAPEPTLFTEVPTKADLNKYVKFENVTLTANATFTTSGASNATMVVNGKNVTLRNNFKLAATLSKDKAYNIVGFVAIYNSTIQVYFLSAEEYVAPEPCTLATPVNWDAPIAAEANTDQWYAVNVKSAIEAGKDLALTVTNPGTEAVEITIEAYADCPATELIVKSTKTFNAGETKTTTVKYDEYLADQVEVVYLHVVTSGDLTIGTEAIEPCSKATPINWDAPITAAANIDAWYAVNVESAIAAGKDLALTVTNPGTEAVEITIEAYADCPATELIVKSTSTINAGASKTTTVKYDEYLADQVKVVYMHVTTKGGEIKVEAETAKFNVTATAENGTVEGAGVYEQGTEATLTATPAEGYEFVNWTVAGEEVSTENPYKFTVTADVALVANFKKAAPAMETVYFINNKSWSKVNTYAWEPVQNAGWPGKAATKEAEKVAGYDVYSYTAEVGKHKNVIFNNGSSQTADLKWTAGKYYWMGNAKNFAGATKEEAEAALAKPVEYESVYFVNAQGWAKVNIYTWSPEVGTWPGVAMKKEAEQLAGFNVYSYTVEKGTSFGGMLFNNGSGTQTGDLQWTAGKYYVKDGWYTKEEAEAKLAGPVVTVWTMVGDKALFGTDWDLNATANDLVKQEDGSWVLTLTNKTLAAKSYEYKAAKDRAWTTTVPGGDNAKLTISKAGQYDITFTLNAAATSVTAKATYIPAKYNVTVTAENGTVEGAGEYEEGATATLTATANEGYEFVNWTKGEEVVSTENPYTFTVNADVALVANFEIVEPEKPEPTYTENNLNPYAFGLESKLVEGALNVTYRLNNSNATDVDVVIYNGEEVVKVVAGTTTIGKNTVEVPTAELPAGVELTWSVIVNGTSVEAPTQESKIYSFYHPSGLDIDINPENETFGMLLVNEGMQKVKGVDGYVSSGFGSGIYAFTPSFDLIPNGDQPGYNGGVEFTEGRADNSAKTAYAPRRIRISEDGRIFVTSLNTDGNYLWEVNADNLNEWTPVFKGASTSDQAELLDAEGNFIAAPNAGFDVKGTGENLQLAMYSATISGIDAFAMSGFRLHEYNLGTATEWATAPSKALVEGKYAINYTGTQVEYDNEGGFWIASYRGTASDANPGLVHINADGVEDAKLVWNNVRQAGIRFNKDFTKLVVAGNNGAAKKATIYTISKDANGAPVLTQEAVVDMAAVGNNLNDFAWDYAGNLYACGNSSEKLAAWAMPYSGEVETPAASKYAFQLEGEAVEYTEIVMSNLVVTPYGEYDILEASDAMTGIAVMLGVDADGKLVEGSEVTWNGTSMTILSSGVFTKAYNDELATDVYNGKLVIEFYGEEMGLDLYMYGTGAAASVDVVVTDANIAVDEWGSYVVTANWGEGTLTCEVSDTEYEGFMMIEYTITEDDWYIWMAYSATVTTTGNVMTIEGEFTDNYTGTTYNVTISGTLTPTGVEDATVTVKPVKMIKNGQLIIEKDGVQYNANGAQL